MVSPVQLGNINKVYFKGNDDLFNSPGKFSVNEAAAAPAEDVVELSQSEPKKKGGIGKAILGTIGGVVVLALGLWGIFKGKGEKWINKEAATTGEKFKNALAKPGEWIDNNIVKKISGKINEWRGKSNVEEKVDDIVEEVEEVVEDAAAAV